MWKLRGIVVLSVLTVLMMSLPSAYAAELETSPPPLDYYPPVYITAFQTSQTNDTTTELDVVELHNDTGEPVNMGNWSIVAGDVIGDVCQINFASFIAPESYVALSKAGIFDDNNVREYDQCVQDGRIITHLRLENNSQVEEHIIDISLGAWVRKNTTKTYRSGMFTKDFEPMNQHSRSMIYAEPWYDPLDATPLRIVEILAHSKDCSPLQQAPECRDFVKLYNPTTEPVNLAGLRLRVGYAGQNITTGNAVRLTGLIPPGGYGSITAKADGDPLSITNSGGWVWLEDTYGIERYDPTVVEHPSASSSSKTGWVWAYNDATNEWQWSARVSGYGVASEFFIPKDDAANENDTENNLTPCALNQYRNPDTNRCKLKETATSSLKPCASNQFRNPSTNRCKLIATTTSSLSACGPGKYRNPATNRCKSTASSTSSLKPCKPEQFRNPATNRCKSSSVASLSLKPCDANQERNPETNRCRKVLGASIPSAAFAVKEESNVKRNTAMGWVAFAGVGSLAISYGVWEWRREIGGVFTHIFGVFKK